MSGIEQCATDTANCDCQPVHIDPSEMDEVSVLSAYAERSGILMLIAHLRDSLEEESGAAKQLDSLHKMIREDKHRNYVNAAISEMNGEAEAANDKS